jgi:ribosomal protein L11 methyltransferase
MGNQGVQKLARLIVTVPRVIAEPFGAALVELGAGAVEERPTRHADTVEIVLTCPDGESLEPWQDAARNLYEVFVEELGVSADVFTTKRETYELDYHEAWLKHLTPVLLTADIVFSPIDDHTLVPEGQRRLCFTPHPSFGDGSHATTRMAAAAVETYCNAHPGCRMLDVGTGNGVLSLVAATCHGVALGIDIDVAAVEAAEANGVLNGLSERCRFSSQPLEELTERFELVVANLEPRTQLELSLALSARVAPGKALILTGFLEEQAETTLASYLAAGFTVEERVRDQDYVLLKLSAPNRVIAEDNV